MAGIPKEIETTLEVLSWINNPALGILGLAVDWGVGKWVAHQTHKARKKVQEKLDEANQAILRILQSDPEGRSWAGAIYETITGWRRGGKERGQKNLETGAGEVWGGLVGQFLAEIQAGKPSERRWWGGSKWTGGTDEADLETRLREALTFMTTIPFGWKPGDPNKSFLEAPGRFVTLGPPGKEVTVPVPPAPPPGKRPPGTAPAAH